jgi:hypothetical protein
MDCLEEGMAALWFTLSLLLCCLAILPARDDSHSLLLNLECDAVDLTLPK